MAGRIQRDQRATRRDLNRESNWREAVRAQAGSGLSVRAWCRRHRVQEATFYWWRREIARRDAEAPSFVPVRVTSAATEASGPDGLIEIVLAGDRRLRMTGRVNRQALADVLVVLEEAYRPATETPMRSQFAGGIEEGRRC